ncbi:MAG: MmcQ/YjbR family DNA-binding protein [Bacteroidota bacterium]
MNIEEIREYCLDKKAVEESFPFNETTLVFKVKGKIFALLSLDEKRINLKFDPLMAVDLRERYTFVTPGYHMHKKYWNTIILENEIKRELLYAWIDHSYAEVVKKMPLKIQEELNK